MARSRKYSGNPRSRLRATVHSPHPLPDNQRAVSMSRMMCAQEQRVAGPPCVPTMHGDLSLDAIPQMMWELACDLRVTFIEWVHSANHGPLMSPDDVAIRSAVLSSYLGIGTVALKGVLMGFGFMYMGSCEGYDVFNCPYFCRARSPRHVRWLDVRR